MSSALPPRICAACRVRSRLVTAASSTATMSFASATAGTRPFSSTALSHRTSSLHKSRPFGTRSLQPRSQAATRTASNLSSKTTAPASGETTQNSPPSDAPSFQSLSGIPLFYTLFPSTLPMGPPPASPFHIDLRSLKHEFIKLQSAPDPNFDHEPGSDPSLRHASLREAYLTLRSPLLRAEYLLKELHGIDTTRDEVESDVRGLVEEAEGETERAESEEDLEDVRAENEGRIRMEEGELGHAFRDGDMEEARRATARLRCWVRIRERVEGWEGSEGEMY